MIYNAKALFVTILSAATIVAATPIEQRTNQINSPSNLVSNSCNVEHAQCCQSIYQTDDSRFQFLSSALGLSIPVDGLFAGVQCSPIGNLVPILDVSEACNSKPLCCTGNTYKGLINVGCSPISL